MLDATIGGASSNSYVELADAATYFADRLYSEAWDNADAADQAKALITATARLDRESYYGIKTTQEQALKWPRSAASDDEGWYIESDEIPTQLKVATYELALALLQGDILKGSGLESFDKVSVGPLSVVVRQIPAGQLPSTCTRALKGLRRDFARGQVRIVRG